MSDYTETISVHTAAESDVHVKRISMATNAFYEVIFQGPRGDLFVSCDGQRNFHLHHIIILSNIRGSTSGSRVDSIV
jgi:hypothetical protein